MAEKFINWAIIVLVIFLLLRTFVHSQSRHNEFYQDMTYEHQYHPEHHLVESIFHQDSGIYGRPSYEKNLYDREKIKKYPVSLYQVKERSDEESNEETRQKETGLWET